MLPRAWPLEVSPRSEGQIDMRKIGISGRGLPVVRAALCAFMALAQSACGSKLTQEQTATLEAPVLGSASLGLQVLTNSCGANQMQDFFRVVNTGSIVVKLSDIK